MLFSFQHRDKISSRKINPVDSPCFLEGLSQQQRPDNLLARQAAQVLPSETTQFLDMHYLAYDASDRLFFVAFPGSAAGEKLGSWQTPCLA